MTRYIQGLIMAVLVAILPGCSTKAPQTVDVSSPDGKNKVQVSAHNHTLTYQIVREGEFVVKPSGLGFLFQEQPELGKAMKINRVERTEKDTTWSAVWGEQEQVRNHYKGLKVFMEETQEPNRKLNLEFRVYNDGVGFRYEFPEQEGMEDFVITAENTVFTMADDHRTWWNPDGEFYEHLYNDTPLNQVDSASTPLTMKDSRELYMSIHEAALTDYAGMTLVRSDDNPAMLISELVPWADGAKVKTSAPRTTPWRTIQIAESAGDLIESQLIMNLNKPNKLKHTSWIKPMKYVGIWWEMHIGLTTWFDGERHGATTANTKKYIDFAAANNISGVLVEGWNTGWKSWGGEDIFDYAKPYNDYNLQELAKYAAGKGVNLIGHHETGGDAEAYEKQMDEAFKKFQNLDMNAVKTGYAGKIRPLGEHHHGQYMVNHYRKVVKKAADYGIMVNAHEPIKPTGIRRTYPNMMTREGVRGMEYNAWSKGNPPEHTVILPFTRMLGGPLDYTPGIFDIMIKTFMEKRQKWQDIQSGFPVDSTRVHSTLAKQLALMVVLYSPMQMAADLPDNYKDEPAFEFVRKLVADWKDSRVLNAEIGDFVTIARKERNGDRWFMGSITDKEGRNIKEKLNFLDEGKQYVAEVYKDAPDAGWKTNPGAYEIENYIVDSEDIIDMKLAPGGGYAAVFYPATKADKETYKAL